jgi:hypothetical protein
VAAAPARPGWARVGFAALCLLVAVLGAARWTGQAPFGSDNDEYQLVARQLLELEGPVVAGVEGTKYPLGYPAVLAALDAVGLPMVDAALALNVLLVGATAAGAAFAARHLGAVAVVVAAGVVLASRPLWAATQSTMPDVALTAVVALAIVWAARLRPLAVLTVLAAVAAALKSVGLLLGVAATVALLAQRRPWRRAVLPVAAAGAVTVVMTVVVARYPEHTTGYARTFFLEDPYDAAGGRASLVDVAGRVGTRMDAVLDDATKAVWGDLEHGAVGWGLTLALVAAGIAGARAAARPLVTAFVVADLLALAVWPYSSVRFGLPLVPIAALGAAELVSLLARPVPPRLAAAVASVAVVAAAAAAVPDLRAEADREGELYAGLHRARADVAVWLDEHAPAATTVLVSPDYRELALELRRPVLPLPYTGDPDDLLDAAARGTHLVVARGLYGSREVVVGALLRTHGSRFDLVHQNERFDVYRTLGA